MGTKQHTHSAKKRNNIASLRTDSAWSMVRWG